MKLALIDGDALVFAAGFVVGSNEPNHYAFKIVKNIIDKTMSVTQANDYKIFLGSTDKSNFRYEVAKTKPYKETRQKQERPYYEADIREYLFRLHLAIEVKGMETDDALGIEQMENEGTIICSNDKDLDMIPGWHYDLDFGKTRNKVDGSSYRLKAYKNKAMYLITDPGFISLRKNPENGKQVLCGGGYLWFCCQLLLGDSTDNIPNLARGYGPKKVYEVLKDCATEEQGLKRVYEEYCHVFSKENWTKEQMQSRLKEIAQLVWIRRKKEKDIIFPRSWIC